MAMEDGCNKEFNIFQIYIGLTSTKQVKMTDKIRRKTGNIGDIEQGPPWHFEHIISPSESVTGYY